MGEAKRRKDQGLPPKKKKSKNRISAFAELKKGVQRQSKQTNNHDVIKEKQAIAFLQAGKLKEAETIYRELVAKKSKNHIVYGNLAILCGMNGERKEKLDLLKYALKLKPNYPEAHNNLGNHQRQEGNFDAAICSYQKAITLKPNYPEAYFNLGSIYQQKGNIDKAIDSYQKAINIKPNYPEAYYDLGNIYQQKGNIDKAIDSYQQAIKLKPNSAETYNNLGNAYNEKGDTKNSIFSFRQAINLKPNFSEAHNNLANAFLEKGNFKEAISYFQQALNLNHNYPDAHYNLGRAFQKIGNINAAISSYQQAINLKSSYIQAYCELGSIFLEKGDLSNAISYYKQALILKPDYENAHFCLGYIFLFVGKYQQGWFKYEYRFKKSKNPVRPHANPQIPQWKSETLDLNEKLLIISEQGLGDTMQFMRYIPKLKQQGFDVSFCAQPKLHDLIKSSGITSNPLTPEQGNDIKEGKWIPLLSVPRLLEVTPKNPVVTEPYIHCSNELIAKWKERLSNEKVSIIGINWQGDPHTEKNNLKGRSIPLEIFSTIAKRHNCKFLSLQKGFGSEQLESCSFKNQFVDCQDIVNETWGFLETAAIIANCDLVITSDTSVAHLAAGMGQATWCLLQYVPEWRWGMKGKTTFWYPSMKIFRQQERNNWTDVMERVASELKSYELRA